MKNPYLIMLSLWLTAMLSGCAARMVTRDDGSHGEPRGGVLRYDTNFAQARVDALRQANEYCGGKYAIATDSPAGGRLGGVQNLIRFECK